MLAATTRIGRVRTTTGPGRSSGASRERWLKTTIHRPPPTKSASSISCISLIYICLRIGLRIAYASRMRTDSRWKFALFLAFSVAGFAQEAGAPDTQPGGGWRRFGEPAGSASASVPPPADSLPPGAQLVVPAGTWITVRVDQPLSSDRNQPGDAFTATLAQPIVANGRVIARRGQTVSGVVS